VRFLPVCIAVAFVLAAPAVARAQEDDEEQLRLLFAAPAKASVGSKSETPADPDDVAAEVTVFTHDEIRALGCRTLADILDSVPSTYVADSRTNSAVGIRGFANDGDANSRVLLLLDGHVLNDGLQYYAPLDTGFPVALSEIERVEVIAGPVSAIYGSNAFFGVVNVVTRRPAHAEGVASVTGGTYGYGQAQAAFGSEGLTAFATGRHIEGESFHYPAQIVGPSRSYENGTNWDQDGAAYVRATKGPVNFFATAFGRRVGVPGGQFGIRFGDKGNWLQALHGASELTASLLHQSNFNVRARAYTDVVQISEFDLYDVGPPFRYTSSSQGIGAEAIAEWTAGPSDLVASVENNFTRVTDVGGIAANNDVVRATAQERLAIASVGHVEAGVYVEDSRVFGVGMAPRAGLVLHSWSGSTFKADAGRGFRNPTLFERYSSGGAAADLAPEIVDSLEGLAEQRLSGPIRLFASAFVQRYQKPIVRQVDGSYVNGERLDADGLTGGAAWQSPRLRLRVDATGFQANHPDGSGPVGAPEWIAHGIGIVALPKQVGTIGLKITGVGKRVDRLGLETVPPYVVADLSADLTRLLGRFDLSATVTNLGDARYGQPVGSGFVFYTMPSPRRGAYLELRADF
jgi:outer membrane receptor protein involved in Fe transport